MDLRNKKVTVVGLGDSGLKSALLLEREEAIVSVTDESDTPSVRENAKALERDYLDIEIGEHTEPFLEDTELLVISPGVEDNALPIKYAKENNIPIISELELGFNFCKGPIIAVTGTNGKSTAVSLLGDMIRSAGLPVNVCGNIGNSLSGEIDKIDEDTNVVLEVSSFQLEWIVDFRPKISAILNIAEDHLDRYKSFKEYFDAKKEIFRNQKEDDFLILNYDDKRLRDLPEKEIIKPKVLYFSAKKKVDGIYLDKGSVKVSFKGKEKTLFKLEDALLKGDHNKEDILAMSLMATLLDVEPGPIKSAINRFHPLSHRFETVRTFKGVEFIDDSKATNIDSARRALKSLKKKTILIAGGKDKNLSYEKILPAIKNVKKIVLIGETRPKMRKLFKGKVPLEESETLEDAVLKSFKSAKKNEVVLLSPMSSSFDMFQDYKERGEVFKKAVWSLK